MGFFLLYINMYIDTFMNISLYPWIHYKLLHYFDKPAVRFYRSNPSRDLEKGRFGGTKM